MQLPIIMHAEFFMPARSHPGDAGLDCRATIKAYISPGQTVKVPLGFACAIPLGYVGLLLDRSGNASRGLKVVGGVIDAGYRGELAALLLNTCNDSIDVAIGHRVCQLVIVPCLLAEPMIVKELPETPRGPACFGSTGR